MDVASLMLQLLLAVAVEATILWDEWWAYEGVSGPDFWGIHNDAWALCKKGKFQSPVDIDPTTLIYDPNLEPLTFDSSKVNGVLMNTGQDITLQLFNNSSRHAFRFSGGPLSYSYQVHSIKLHFGTFDHLGSEHTVAGRQFPLEIQIIGYNTDLYQNFTEALLSTHGLAVLAILGTLDESINQEFDIIVEAAKAIHAKGLSKEVLGFSIAEIIPPSDYYITYEGSITQPSCQETVTWAVINKPLHVTKDQVEALRRLNRWSKTGDGNGTPLMENNFRPTRPINRRPIRTNISPYRENEECHFKLKTSYKVNEHLIGV